MVRHLEGVASPTCYLTVSPSYSISLNTIYRSRSYFILRRPPQLHFLCQLFDILLFKNLLCSYTLLYLNDEHLIFYFPLDNWGNGIFPEADFETEMLNSRYINKICNSPTFVTLLISKLFRKIYVKQLPYYNIEISCCFTFRYFLVFILFFLFFKFRI